jgi:hypothetical protein
MKQINDVDDPWIAAWNSCRAEFSVNPVLYVQVQDYYRDPILPSFVC